MFSHRHLYEDSPAPGPQPRKRGSSDDALMSDVSIHNVVGASADATAKDAASDDSRLVASTALSAAGTGKEEATEAAAEDDEEEEEDLLGFWNAVIWLGIITVFISILSDAISASIEDAASRMGISKVFVAAILLPIVGNAAEHAGAVMFAMKGKLDLSLGVAIGSSTQIALCVLPLLVIIGWCGRYDLSMNFGSFEAGTLLLSVISVTFAIKDGNSNWLLGLTLCAAYLIIAVGFWAHHDQDLNA